MKKLMLFYFLFQTVNLFAQDESYSIEGKMIYGKHGFIKNPEIMIQTNDSVYTLSLDSIEQNEKQVFFNLNLHYNHNYLISFKSASYLHKTIEIRTKGVTREMLNPKYVWGEWEVQMIRDFNIKGDTIFDQPVLRLAYNENEKTIDLDQAYALSNYDQIQAIINKTAYIEKMRAESVKAYQKVYEEERVGFALKRRGIGLSASQVPKKLNVKQDNEPELTVVPQSEIDRISSLTSKLKKQLKEEKELQQKQKEIVDKKLNTLKQENTAIKDSLNQIKNEVKELLNEMKKDLTTIKKSANISLQLNEIHNARLLAKTKSDSIALDKREIDLLRSNQVLENYIKSEMEEERKQQIIQEKIEKRNSLQYSGIGIAIFTLFGLIFLIGKIKLPKWALELSVFLPFLVFFEFLLVITDPYVDAWSEGVPLIKLGLNVLMAAMIFPLHSFFESFLKRRLFKSTP